MQALRQRLVRGLPLSDFEFRPYSKDQQLGRGPKKNAKPEYEKKALLARCNSLCEARTRACSGRGNQAHHVLRRSQGGSNDLGNLLWVCRGCHDFIHKHIEQAYKQGWLKKSGKAGK